MCDPATEVCFGDEQSILRPPPKHDPLPGTLFFRRCLACIGGCNFQDPDLEHECMCAFLLPLEATLNDRPKKNAGKRRVTGSSDIQRLR